MLVNIEVCSNNRNDNLFKFFIKSLHFIKDVAKFCSITMNYNGDITKEEIDRANNAIESLGFTLYWKYNTYDFEPNKHQILKIRYDCDKIGGTDSKYVLLLDDDSEFLFGYDRQLLAAILHLEAHPEVGIVSFKQSSGNDYDKDTIYPVGVRYAFSCFGGLLVRRIADWGGLYPKECLGLYGGGEEQLQGVEILNYGLEGCFINTDAYRHEHHWTMGTPSGQGAYSWDWDMHNKDTVMGRIHSYDVVGYDRARAWAKEPYWKDGSKIVSFGAISKEQMLEKLIGGGDLYD